MPRSTLTFLFAIVAPLSMGSLACFLSTEGDGYDYDSYDTGDGCPIGWEGCQCTSGGKCNDPFKCDTNQNICFADVCPVGTEGCACTPAGACDPGLACYSEYCVNPGCTPGTEGCTCTPGGGCDNGLTCLSDTCVDASGYTTNDTTEPPSDDTGTDPTTSGSGDADAGADESSTSGDVLDGTTTNGAGGSSTSTGG